jgi:large subunit ribosomal protein L17
MKHRISYRKLNRTTSHRWAMLRNMVNSLVHHERIRTTVPKANELRRVADRLVTTAKKGIAKENSRSRVLARAVLRDEEALEKLFSVLAPRYKYNLPILFNCVNI